MKTKYITECLNISHMSIANVHNEMYRQIIQCAKFIRLWDACYGTGVVIEHDIVALDGA